MKMHTSLHKNDVEAQEANLLLCDEYQFPHAIYLLQPIDMTTDGLKYAYNKMCTFLKLDQN